MPHPHDGFIVVRVGLGRSPTDELQSTHASPPAPIPAPRRPALHNLQLPHRQPYLNTDKARTTFLHSLEATRKRYVFGILGYVLMPEHVHLLITEPEKPLAKAIQALKVSVSKQLPQTPFWLPRYHDRNITNHEAVIATLRYIHRNPVKRGLVQHPQDWPWSTFRFYYLHEPIPITIAPPTLKPAVLIQP